jgi:hypothetical protein
MTVAINAVNARGHLTITRDYVGYGYLGKYALPSLPGLHEINFTCAGTPRVFFTIPYNVADSTGQSWHDVQTKAGVALAGLRNNGGNSWTAKVLMTMPASGTMPAQYLRVFGRVASNWPSGSGRMPNLKIWTDTGALCFDAGVRMLRLAGDTYDVELALTHQVPGEADANDVYDVSVPLPFDLANKSIAASTRSTIFYPYWYDSYEQWDGGNYTVNRYDIKHYNTLYAASGNQLKVKRCATDSSQYEVVGPYMILNSGVTSYSRLAVIDNTKYP